jgi:hypothetical protein
VAFHPTDSQPELVALAGQLGIMRVVMVDYPGFEPVQGSLRRRWLTANLSIHRWLHSLCA